LTLTGRRPSAASRCRIAETWKWTWPLSSEAPRACRWPSRTVGSNGGVVHSSLDGQDLGVEPGRLHQPGQVLGRAADVAGMVGVAGDGGDGAPLGQLAHERVRLGLDKGVDVGHTVSREAR
jgi:hypothetical protein